MLSRIKFAWFLMLEILSRLINRGINYGRALLAVSVLIDDSSIVLKLFSTVLSKNATLKAKRFVFRDYS